MPDSVAAFNSRSRGLVLAFHGCDKKIGLRLLNGSLPEMKQSNNTYDWLGSGCYFFEQDIERARHFAQTCAANPKRQFTQGKINEVFVLGAVIDLGHCLDLSSQSGIIELAQAYQIMRQSFTAEGKKIPANEAAYVGDQEFIKRKLDRSLINYLHTLRKNAGLAAYDTVRSPFPQGEAIAPNSAFHRFSHIQIAVRDPACIQGFFLPR